MILERIERAFYTRSGRPQLKLADGRKAIREYQTATADPVGTLELMLTFVETGTRFTRNFGDIEMLVHLESPGRVEREVEGAQRQPALGADKRG